MESLRSIKKIGLHTFSSILVLSVTLFLFGGVISGFSILNKVLGTIKNDLTVAVYLEDNTTPEIIGEMMVNFEKIENVKKTIFRSKEDALKKFKKMMGEDIDEIFTYLDVNPLPSSFLIKVNSEKSANVVIKRIKQMYPFYISNVSFSGKTYKRISSIIKITRNISMAIIIILLLASILTIFVSVVLTIHSRREEIEIMQLVGATNSFIVAPFIFESFIIAIISSALSILFLYFLKIFILSSLITKLPILIPFLTGIPSVRAMVTIVTISISLCLAGSLIGIGRNLK
jgi:cell division transport system permease protein